jgi:hypothetical protein
MTFACASAMAVAAATFLPDARTRHRAIRTKDSAIARQGLEERRSLRIRKRTGRPRSALSRSSGTCTWGGRWSTKVRSCSKIFHVPIRRNSESFLDPPALHHAAGRRRTPPYRDLCKIPSGYCIDYPKRNTLNWNRCTAPQGVACSCRRLTTSSKPPPSVSRRLAAS